MPKRKSNTTLQTELKIERAKQLAAQKRVTTHTARIRHLNSLLNKRDTQANTGTSP